MYNGNTKNLLKKYEKLEESTGNFKKTYFLNIKHFGLLVFVFFK